MDSDFEDEPQGTLTKTPRKSAAGRKLVRWNRKMLTVRP